MNDLVYRTGEREITMYEGGSASTKMLANGNYRIVAPFTKNTDTLVRDVDFGVIPKTKQPSLFKAGAEKVCAAFGLLQRYDIVSAIENADAEDPFFYYTVKCSLVKIADNGTEYVFSTGYGSANTKESRNGFSGAYNAANGSLKMAQKRALVSAAISVSGLSSIFTQDIENETFMNKANDLTATMNDDDPISAKQTKRIFAIASTAGLTAKQAKDKIVAMGYASTKDITQKDYEKVCEAMKGTEENA